MSTVGKRVKKVRKARQFSQKVFAVRLGVNQGHISKIETGVAEPSKQLLKAISRQFGVEEEWLIEGKSQLSEKDGLTLEEIEEYEILPEETTKRGLLNYLRACRHLIGNMTDWFLDVHFAFDLLGKPDDILKKEKAGLEDDLGMLKFQVSQLFNLMDGKVKPQLFRKYMKDGAQKLEKNGEKEK